jgi:GT2 family glycosyltransferase
MTEQAFKFGILLPVKIDDEQLTREQMDSLSRLAVAAANDDTHQALVYLGIDNCKLKTPAVEELQKIFSDRQLKIDIVSLEDSRKGQVCYYWRTLAERAVNGSEKCDFFCLLGDDVDIHTPNWMSGIVSDFKKLHAKLKLIDTMFGFGCVAIKDLQAPGFPTFPVLHRIHFELNGELFSDKFVNQDADPFLFQLYRYFNANTYSETVELTNNVGGVQLLEDTSYKRPRYNRQHIEWSTTLLDQAVARLCANDTVKLLRKPTVDVVVPTFRVERDFLEGILDLKSTRANVNFIFVVDNPRADVQWLRVLEKTRSLHDLRVRVNESNMGASRTRNVGLNESAAEYLLFLDDDLHPNADIIDEYVQVAETEEGAKYDGFVGFSELPEKPNEVFPTAVHFSGVSFFWRAAAVMSETPWGITANLFVRRTACTYFDSDYIKTGGGEDIHFCLTLKRGRPLLSVPGARIVHPWWNNGARCYSHFFNWSQSDGILMTKFPKLTYRCCPDAVEFTILSLLVLTALAIYQPNLWKTLPFLPVAILAVDAAIDLWEKYLDPKAEPYSQGSTRLVAVLESTLIKNYSALGHLWGHIQRGALTNVCKRFDWFCGQTPDVVVVEQTRAFCRCCVFSAAVVVLVYWVVHYQSVDEGECSYFEIENLPSN